MPQATPWTVGPHQVRDHPGSPDVAVGDSQRFTLYTHCGIDFRVDFDGSFWQSYNVGQTPIPFTQFPKGSMTLLTEDVAVFRFRKGDGEGAIYFVRNDTPKPTLGCD